MSKDQIDNLHLKFVHKFNTLEQFSILVGSFNAPNYEDFLALLESTIFNYYTYITSLLNEFYTTAENTEVYIQKFNSILRRYNIDSDLDKCIQYCHNIYAFIKEPTEEIKKYYKDLQLDSILIDVNIIKYEICCNERMLIIADGSRLYCKYCHYELEVKGMILDDIQYHTQVNKKGRSNTYDRKRNFRTGLECTLCLEDVKISPIHDAQIRSYIINEDYGEPGSAVRLTIDIIRQIFKELKITTQYNKHAALFLSKYSGVRAPYFRTSEIDEIVAMYVKIDTIIHMRNNPLTANMNNTPYCPYLIWRIVEYKWPNDPEKLRIWYFIYIKEPTTIHRLDNLWCYICEALKPQYNIKYSPLKYYESQSFIN